MSRKNSNWFSHDSNATNDKKIVMLIDEYGYEGYGYWWRIVEILRCESNYKYCISDTIGYRFLSKELNCPTEKVKQFISDCIHKFQLLQTDEEYLWSASLLQRMEHMDKQKETLSERGRKGAIKTNTKKAQQAEGAFATSAQQATPPLATSAQQATENPAKEKKLKEKKVKEETATPSPCAAMFVHYRQKALDDERFTYPYISSGLVTQQQLGHWLDAFNRTLGFRAEQAKTEQDYRMHFANWFKFRNPKVEDSATFGNPQLPEQHNKAPAVIAVNAYLKTPDQLSADIDKYQHDLLQKLNSG